jgi:hypothetical protein
MMMPFIVLAETKHDLRPYTRPTSTPPPKSAFLLHKSLTDIVIVHIYTTERCVRRALLFTCIGDAGRNSYFLRDVSFDHSTDVRDFDREGGRWARKHRRTSTSRVPLRSRSVHAGMHVHCAGAALTV